MYFDIWEYSGDKLKDYPHGKGMQIFLDQSIFTGNWEKGLKVGTGVFEIQDITITVKFRSGKIHKFIEVKSKYIEYALVEFRQSNYNKLGEFYQECSGGPAIFLHYFRNIPLFGGRPSHLREILMLIDDSLRIFIHRDKNMRISEIQRKSNIFIVNTVNIIPVGRGKIRFDEGLTLKGVLRAGYISGMCKVKNDDFYIIFDGDIFPYIFRIRVGSKRLKIGFDLNIFQDYSDLKLKFPELYDFGMKTCFFIMNFLIQFSYLSKVNYSITASVNSFRRWDIFEVVFNEKYKIYKHFRDIKAKKSGKSDKNRNQRSDFKEKLLHIKNISNSHQNYEKIDINSIKKILYDNQEIYLGEIKGNSRNGLGIFKFNDGTLFKGYFLENQLHGKGRLISQDFTLIGFWQFNKLEKVHRIFIDN